MVISITITAITAIAMFFTILIKPFVKIGKHKLGLYWIISLIGGLAMLIFSSLTIKEAWAGFTAKSAVNPIKILTLFISMTLISIFLGDAGFFDLCANKIFLKSKGNGQLKLFLAIYFCVAFLTVFTSNDIIVLTFTPPIIMFSKKAKVSPIPYLIAEFVAANTWSMALIIGNPTNIYLASLYGLTFFDYLKLAVLPTLCSGTIQVLLLILIFKKALSKPIVTNSDNQTDVIKIKKVPLIVSLCHLLACIILLAISYYIGIEMWFVCLCFALSLTIFNLIYGLVKEKNVNALGKALKKAPWELIPFVLSMFIIVLALDKSMVTNKLNALLISGDKIDGLSFGFISAFSANLLNNIPMSVLFERIINSHNVYAVMGTIFGSNVGAYITPVGALAGIMWMKILREYDVELSFFKFSKYGIILALPTLLIACLMLLI